MLFSGFSQNMYPEHLTLIGLAILMHVSPSTSCSPNIAGKTVLSKSVLSPCPRNITTLDISGQSLQTLEINAFEEFYALVSIDMYNNEIADLPVGLFDQPFKSSLTHINAANNKITALNNDLFKNNFNLIGVDLSYNEISFVDSNVFHEDLTKLKTVNIAHNNMTYFEPWPYVPNTYDRADGDRLQFDMSHNQISNFTNKMNWTYNLREPFNYRVELQFNNISQLSTEMFYQYRDVADQPSILTEFLAYELNATNNAFFCDCNLYDIARDLQSSLFLYFRVDEYRYRCGSPAHLAGVDYLHDITLDKLICNRTDNCPTNCTCQDLPYLSTLSINCTKTMLNKLPETIPSFSRNIKYVSLYLHGNMITSIPKTNYTGFIKNLTVSDNKITYIDGEVIKEMEHLEKLDISSNQLKYVPKEIQRLSFDDVKIDRNPFECDCDMIWMADWTKLSNDPEAKQITCSFKDETKVIADLTEDDLECTIDKFIIIFSVISGLVVSGIIAGIITAKRCPYETKVLVYKLFRIHPRDRYKVDFSEAMDYDAYLSYDGEDIQVRQWIKTVFMKKLEENGKKKYRFFCPQRDANGGEDYGNSLVTEMSKSKRVFILLSPGFFKDEWRIFEADQAEVEHNGCDDAHPRVVYIIWYDQNVDIKEKIQEEPWKSRLAKKKVFSPDEKFFWSKVRYELPVKPRYKNNRVDNSYTDIKEAAKTTSRGETNQKANQVQISTKCLSHNPKNSIIDLHFESLA